MITTTEKTIGEIVAEDYRTASVFKAFGIDFCCNGNITIDEVCQAKGIFKNLLLQDLVKLKQTKNESVLNYNDWPMDLLADHIEKIHHRYIEESTPQLKIYLEKIYTVHGTEHSELRTVKDLFFKSVSDLTAHMKKEELLLFPFIRKMVAFKSDKAAYKSRFGIQNIIEDMTQDHGNEGDRFRQIANLTKNYTPPTDACNTYKVTLALLKEFEEDLHLHIHLENNILFPRLMKSLT
jgi:regulator of cell morphogenesis and NO signaling